MAAGGEAGAGVVGDEALFGSHLGEGGDVGRFGKHIGGEGAGSG